MTHYDCFFVSVLGAGSPVPGAQPLQLPLGSLHISPVQTAFEPSSVPYYLQQDLEALHRISQQYASPPLGLQSDSVGQGSLLTTHAQSSGSPRVKRHGRGSRRLSLDPYTKLRVEKLEVVSSMCSFSAVHLVYVTLGCLFLQKPGTCFPKDWRLRKSSYIPHCIECVERRLPRPREGHPHPR